MPLAGHFAVERKLQNSCLGLYMICNGYSQERDCIKVVHKVKIPEWQLWDFFSSMSNIFFGGVQLSPWHLPQEPTFDTYQKNPQGLALRVLLLIAIFYTIRAYKQIIR